LAYGKWEEINQENEKIYVYRRWDEDGEYVVALNFSDKANEFPLGDVLEKEPLISNYKNSKTNVLSPWEGKLYRIK